MKLKEGIKKEDLYGVAIKVSKDVEENNQLQQLLLDVGFTWQGGDVKTWPMTKGYIQTMPYGPVMVFVWDVTPFSTFKEVSISDLVEEEYPNYVKAIVETKYLKLDKIYPVIWGSSSNGFVVKDESGVAEEYGNNCFTSATEEEYLAYQASLNPLKQVDDELTALQKHHEEVITEADNKRLDEIMDGVMKTSGVPPLTADKGVNFEEPTFVSWGEKTFAISDDQIKYAVDKLIEYGYTESLLIEKLKEWFPAASVFKKEEKTYRRGQKFKEIKEEAEYILCNAGDHRQMILACLKDGVAYSPKYMVLNEKEITEEEFNRIAANQPQNFILIS